MGQLISLPGMTVLRPRFRDKVKLATFMEIWRYANDDKFLESRELGEPFRNCYKYSPIHGNLLLNEGAAVIWEALTAATHGLFDNTNARINVGTSATAEADTQTGLQGSIASKAMDVGFPTIGGTGNDTVTFQSVFGSAEGNQAWNEFSVDNGASEGIDLNRKVSAQGTKSSGQTWTIAISIQAV